MRTVITKDGKNNRDIQCFGYGEYEGKCTNTAGTPYTPLWCERCDKIRRATITKQLKKILALFDQETV